MQTYRCKRLRADIGFAKETDLEYHINGIFFPSIKLKGQNYAEAKQP
jgi:hypothetical protein